jgi:hypothetical protein
MRITQLNSILLDANCVIELFGIGKWEQFLKANHVFLPSIIAVDEAQFYYDSSGWKDYLIFTKDIENESLTVLEASAIELIDTKNVLKTVEIHDGESEAITILRQEERKDLFFCTGDRGAIIACCLLGLEDRCISLETALKKSGLSATTKKNFTEEFMNKWKKIGWQRKIQSQKRSQE